MLEEKKIDKFMNQLSHGIIAWMLPHGTECSGFKTRSEWKHIKENQSDGNGTKIRLGKPKKMHARRNTHVTTRCPMNILSREIKLKKGSQSRKYRIHTVGKRGQ
jgi:hypothetical protein